MQEDFHYYATYAAAILAGYGHGESMEICHSAQFVDLCSATFLAGLGAPRKAATTQLQLEMMDARTDIVGLQNITRIWSSFHFLPGDLYARLKGKTKRYMNKYRLICRPNGELVKKTVELAKGRPLQSVGIAMHVLADTWAHANFAGTPSLAINNTFEEFYELLNEDGKETERQVRFWHRAGTADDLEGGYYINTVYQANEHSIMNLGHGRAGHLPDYSFMRYRYMPSWNDYRMVIKDNPSDYYKAFCQMLLALKYLRGEVPEFETGQYAFEDASPYEERIRGILTKRQPIACEDWKRFGEELSGYEIEAYSSEKYEEEYKEAANKEETFLGKFFDGAILHKGMVSGEIFRSGNLLAGFVQERGKKS